MADPILHGPAFSTYVRSARLALEEKGVGYTLNEFDFLSGGMPEEQMARHPFGKVPAFEHDGFALYETFAIARYVDECFEGPALQPADAKDRARMTQIVGIVNSYTYGPTIGTLVIQRLIVPSMGGTPDEAAIEAELPNVRRCMEVYDGALAESPYLAGDAVSFADLHLAPIYTYFTMTPESGPILEDKANLKRWWDEVSQRESVVKTVPQLG